MNILTKTSSLSFESSSPKLQAIIRISKFANQCKLVRWTQLEAVKSFDWKPVEIESVLSENFSLLQNTPMVGTPTFAKNKAALN